MSSRHWKYLIAFPTWEPPHQHRSCAHVPERTESVSHETRIRFYKTERVRHRFIKLVAELLVGRRFPIASYVVMK